jgi:hypothetical protein
MATCDLGFSHEDEDLAPEPEPVIIEPGTSDNDVKIAEVEAAARIETERIYAGERDVELVAEVERLRGQVAGMQTVLETLAPPDPELLPAPDPAPAPIPVPVPESVPAPPETEPKPEGKKKGGMWDGYN